MTTIGAVTITVDSPLVDGMQAILRASISGDATAPAFAWAPPAGSSAPVGQTARLVWPFVAATDEGVITVTVSDPAAVDSPKTQTLNLQAMRAVSRFGRLYVAHDPGPPGPATWILAGPGALPAGIGTDVRRALLHAQAPTFVEAGQPIFMRPDGAVDKAKADAFATALAIGVVIDGAVPGKEVGFTADGEVTRADWSVVTQTPHLLPGSRYFLSSARAGRLVTTPPKTGFIVPVGRAVSLSTLEVEVGQPIEI